MSILFEGSSKIIRFYFTAIKPKLTPNSLRFIDRYYYGESVRIERDKETIRKYSFTTRT